MTNPEPEPILGGIYVIRSRNLCVGVYDGCHGFIGIRLKFSYHYLFTEWWEPRYGTVSQIVKMLGIIPLTVPFSEDSPELFALLKKYERDHFGHDLWCIDWLGDADDDPLSKLCAGECLCGYITGSYLTQREARDALDKHIQESPVRPLKQGETL